MTDVSSSLLRDGESATALHRQRWQVFESLCGERIRARDAGWAAGLSPAARLAVADDQLTRPVADAQRATGTCGRASQESGAG